MKYENVNWLYKRYENDVQKAPVSLENPCMPNMHITKPEWHKYGQELTNKQIPLYCQYCHNYQWDKIPPCNKCRIQTEHDLRTARHHEVENYCKYCTEWLEERPEEDAYDPCHKCQTQHHTETNSHSNSVIIPKWLLELPRISIRRQ
jgi:hypothetical protein